MCTSSGRLTKVELADIFSQHAEAYIASHGVSSIQRKAIHAISNCRTAALGGHVLRCDHCDALEISYNSCRYRHCPKCQAPKKVRWLDERKAELLPVPYFHVVFTLPHELNPLASYNPALIYNLLFKAAWASVNTLGHDKNRLNGQMGMTAFLHTWNQQVNQHIHLHCMVPAGALCDDGMVQWRASKSDYLFPVKVMSKLFGKFFLTELTKAFQNHELQFKGCTAHLAEESQFMKWKAQLKPKPKRWNVYAKEPFNGAVGGMEYLGRYFVKTAIGNERLVSCDEHQVTFKYRDSRDNDKTKIMQLSAHEFIRRYLKHILPNGFMRVRYFGFLANSVKAKNIAMIRSLLCESSPLDATNIAAVNDISSISMNETTQAVLSISPEVPYLKPTASTVLQPKLNVLQHAMSDLQQHVLPAQGIKKETTRESAAELMQRVVGIDVTLCKQCKIGHLEKVQVIYPDPAYNLMPWDTS